MSYATRYFAEFIDAPARNETNPYANRYVRVRFMLDGYTGAAEELEIFADDSLRSKKMGTDSLFETINAKTVSIKLRTHSIDVAQALFATTDRQWRVEILRRVAGGTDDYRLYFAGWLVPTYTQYDYKKPPFALNLTAGCGLASLKDRPLLDGGGKRLSGNDSLSTVIRTALLLTGHDLDLVSCTNLYELSDMAVGQTVPGATGGQVADPSRDPLRQTVLNDLSLVNDKNETLSAYDALKVILESMPGLRISQQNGQWRIVRGPEAPGGYDPINPAGNTIHGRIYPARGNINVDPQAHQSFSLNQAVYPDQAVRAKTGGSTGLTPQKGGIRIEQQFGRLISEFPNGNLTDVDTTGLPVGWERVIFTADQAQRIGLGTEIAPYKLHIKGAGTETHIFSKTAVLVRIQFPTGIATILPQYYWQKKWTLKGTYQVVKARSAQISVFAKRLNHIQLADGSGSWHDNPAPKDQNTIRFDNSVIQNGVRINNPAPTDFSITFEPLDKVTDLYILFHEAEDLERSDKRGGQNDPGAYTDFWNLSLATARDGFNLTGQSVSTSRDGRTPETMLTLTYGDYPGGASNGLERTGTLTTRATGSPTASWFKPNDGARLNGKPLIQHHLQLRASQAMQAVDSWQGKITGPLPNGMHTVLRFTDVGRTNRDGLFITDAFLITALDTDERLLEHSVTAVRLMDDIALPSQKAYWQTPDGDLLQGTDNTGAVTDPPAQPTLPVLPPDLLGILRGSAPGGRLNPLLINLPGGIYAKGNTNNNPLVIDSGTGAAAVSINPVFRPTPDLPQLL